MAGDAVADEGVLTTADGDVASALVSMRRTAFFGDVVGEDVGVNFVAVGGVGAV